MERKTYTVYKITLPSGNVYIGLEVLEQAVLDYLDAHPELFRQTNNEDMWDYRDSDEDVGDDDYDDEEY